MADHVPTVINELLDLTGFTQGQLAKKLRTSQSNISKWRSGKQNPNKAQWDRVVTLYIDLAGDISLDAKVAPYDEGTKKVIHGMVDDYLKRIPMPPNR